MEKSAADHSCNCKNCGERIFNGECCYMAEYHGKRSIRSVIYCRFCFEDGTAVSHLASLGTPVVSAEQNSERERETFAAYQAAGCSSQYFEDMERREERRLEMEMERMMLHGE